VILGKKIEPHPVKGGAFLLRFLKRSDGSDCLLAPPTNFPVVGEIAILHQQFGI